MIRRVRARDVAGVELSGECLTSMPCRHTVTVTLASEEALTIRLAGSADVVRLCAAAGLPQHAHLDYLWDEDSVMQRIRSRHAAREPIPLGAFVAAVVFTYHGDVDEIVRPRRRRSVDE